MSQKLGALFHEEVTALCTLTSEFHYLVVYFLPNASNASYGYGQHSESPFPVLNARRGNQFKFGGNGKFQTDCVPYSIILKNNTFFYFFEISMVKCKIKNCRFVAAYTYSGPPVYCSTHKQEGMTRFSPSKNMST